MVFTFCCFSAAPGEPLLATLEVWHILLDMSWEVSLTCLPQPPQGQLNLIQKGVLKQVRIAGSCPCRGIQSKAAPSPTSVSRCRSVFPYEAAGTSGSRAVPAKLGCLPSPEGLILSWCKLAPCHRANGPAARSVDVDARPRAAKPTAPLCS